MGQFKYKTSDIYLHINTHQITMQGQTQPPPISFNLCKRCKILELDDKKLGGRIETSKSGERYVSFGSSKRLLLDYELKDSFPELPQLSASASSGCAVCANLKKRLVDFANDKGKGKNDLFIHKACYWIRHETSYPDIKPWLEALWVFFKFEEDKYLHALRFEINAEPTGCHPSTLKSRCSLSNRA